MAQPKRQGAGACDSGSSLPAGIGDEPFFPLHEPLHEQYRVRAGARHLLEEGARLFGTMEPGRVRPSTQFQPRPAIRILGSA
jgi:hypothetical protein